jgi:hypothetical protein
MRPYTASIVLLLFAAPVAHALDTEINRRSFQDVKTFQILVEPLPPKVERAGLTAAAIQADVELKLRQAGIKIADPKAETLVLLYVSVQFWEDSPVALWPYTINVEVLQDVLLARDTSILVKYSPTWSTHIIGGIKPAGVRDVRGLIKDQVDKFINAYLAENPKK